MKNFLPFLPYFIIIFTQLTSFGSILEPRIIGGHNAISGQFPFAAAIQITTSDGNFFCGGTLLNNEWVVTAGQCVDGAELVSIQLGSTSLTKTDNNRVTVASSQFVLHPDYDPMTLENDIGLIHLRLPLQFTDYVTPVQSLADTKIVDGARVVVLGWGQTSDADGQLSDNLKFVQVSTISNQECQLTYGSQIAESMVCVEGNYNEGSCHGDTGSPLLLVLMTGRAQLVGISSFVSGNGCESVDPSGYTRLFPFIEWIKNVTDIV